MSKTHNIQHEIEVIENLKAKIKALKDKQITRDEIIHIGKWIYPNLSVREIRKKIQSNRDYDIANLENILRFAENRLPITLDMQEIAETPKNIEIKPTFVLPTNIQVQPQKKKVAKTENLSLF